MKPTALKPRLTTVDALRGFALMGIMLAHFIYWYTAGPLPQDVYGKYSDVGSNIATFFNNLFVSGKFFSFFSFLFGLSFYLQMRGEEEAPTRFLARYSWRLLLLMVIGMAHHALWMGDILSIYVPLGFVLLFMRRLSSKWVLVLGVLLALNLPGRIIQVTQFLTQAPGANGGFADFDALGRQYQAVITGGSWIDIFSHNLKNFSTKMEFQVFSGRLFITLGFFLLGMYTGRQKWFEAGEAARPIIRKICKRSAGIMGAGLLTALGMMGANELFQLGWQQSPVVGMVFGGIMDVFNAAMVVFFVSGLTLLMFRASWQKVLYPLAPVGKMALTSYITQTVFGLFLFYGVGYGLYAKTSPGLNYLMAIGFFFVQLAFSKWWLTYFQYGPLEWLWRSGTLLKAQPFLRKKKEATLAAPVQPEEAIPSLAVAEQ